MLLTHVMDLSNSTQTQPAEWGTATSGGLPDHLAGRCKGRGVHLSLRRHASGRAYVVSQADLANPAFDFAPSAGDIVVAPQVPLRWLPALPRVAGLVVEDESSSGPIAQFARILALPMIVALPNGGQFVPGETLILKTDGRVLARIKSA